ncbi:fungal-specific transcription factor domain-containing protein [Pestalotiopsis sp. NC0098]|nr:fungal-specific transcription factor domain-containing protein [Pestalotiopsis sp. NC0098]
MEGHRESSQESVDVLERPAKRQRIALACSSCRDRKVRCDGQKPICGPCTRRGVDGAQCAYAVVASSAKRQSEQEYIACLQQEVRQLRQTITNQNHKSAPVSDVDNGSQLDLPSLQLPKSSVTDLQSRSDDGSEKEAAASSRTRSQPKESSAKASEQHPVSAMGAATSIRPSVGSEMPRNTDFYGQSSIVSLLEQVIHPVRQSNSRAAEQGSSSRDSMAGARLYDDPHHRSQNLDAQDSPLGSLLRAHYALPPREVADELLDVYFDNVHLFYPWTHPASVRNQYRRIWAEREPQDAVPSFEVGLGSPSCPRRVFFLALNAMFALGLQFSRFSAVEKEDAAMMFYQRIEELANMELLGGNSLAHIQAVLLVSQYLLCTRDPSRCWNLTGLACRMAIGFGLQNETQSKDLPAIEVEVRRRVWYGCVQTDMFISMTLGRKTSMSIDQGLPLPSPVDDEVLERVGTAHSSTQGYPSINAFMVENIKLARILGNILEVLYETASDDKTRQSHSQPGPRLQRNILGIEDFGAIGWLEGQLNKFTEDLPVFLQRKQNEGRGASRDVRLTRQTNVLHARILHLRILVHRPSLSAYCADAPPRSRTMHSPTDDSMRSTPAPTHGFVRSMRLPCAIACVQATCDLIRLMEKAITEDSTGAWWFSLFYLVTCGMILLLAQSTPDLQAHIPREDFDMAWNDCIQSLKHISGGHTCVEGYIQLLLALKERITHDGRTPSERPQMSARAAQFDDPMSRVHYRDTNVAPSRVEDGGDHVQNNVGLAAEGQVRFGAQASGFELSENLGLIDPLLVEGHLGFPPGLMIDDPASRAFIPTFF